MSREFPRTRRLNEQLQRTLSEIVRRELDHPAVNTVSFTEVRVTRDLSHAEVFVSLLNPADDPEPVIAELSAAAGMLRGRLGRALKIRKVPELHFRHDASLEQGARLSALIDDAVAEDERRGRSGSEPDA
jgi:ribosome-binding factor A